MPELNPGTTPGRLKILYLTPGLDLGVSDESAVEFLRWLDRDRYGVVLATTGESRNRRLADTARYVDEVWPLPELVPGGRFPSLIEDLAGTRQVDVIHVLNSRLAFDLLPDLAALAQSPGILVQLEREEADDPRYARYVTARYGNLVDRWSVSSQDLAAIVEGHGVPGSAIDVIRPGVDAGSMSEMADAHGALYQRIARERDERRRHRASASAVRGAAITLLDQDAPGGEPAPIHFRGRVVGDQPLVSVVVPCFNHGRWLPETVASIEEQDYPSLEVIIVDDASTDDATRRVLETLERDARARVVRMPVNGGPSRARNVGVERARGRYVLPVDADNLLVPDAVTSLVAQLAQAGELVGFVYPNQQFFGNRQDYAKAPAWSPYRLLLANYCDTCSLFDREVFDRGIRYPEDIVLGHEDWDLALTLAARGVRGEPARGRTVLVRKHGFTRSDLVDTVATGFSKRVRKRHPTLFGTDYEAGRFGAFAGPALRLKAEWSPYLSIVSLSRVDAATEEWWRIAARLRAQTCGDAEYLVPIEGRRKVEQDGPFVRRIPPASSDLPENVIGTGLAMVRGRVAFVCRGTGSQILADPAAIEKLALIFENPEVDAIAFRAPDSSESVPLGLAPDPAPWTPPHALAWRLDQCGLAAHTGLREGDELGSLLRALIGNGKRAHWRWAEGLTSDVPLPGRTPRTLSRPASNALQAPAGLRALQGDGISRSPAGWHAIDKRTIVRHRRVGSEERHLSVNLEPPAGFELDHVIGVADTYAPPGTVKLYATSTGSFLTTETPEAHQVIGPDDRLLASLETAESPGLDALLLGIMHATGQHILVAGRDDPLIGAVEVQAELGWLDPLPLRPLAVPPKASSFGLRGVCRTVDHELRRHRYGIGRVPRGELAGELGALFDEPQDGSVPLWLTEDDRIVPEGGLAVAGVTPRAAARWAAAPIRWTSLGNPRARARAVARRALDLGRGTLPTLGRPAEPVGDPVGYCRASGGPGLVALYAAAHPITGDQLLTNYPLEAQDMGYTAAVRLGWLVDRAPVTGERALLRLTIPWASRFGLEARWQ